MKKVLQYLIFCLLVSASAHAQPETLPTFTLPDPQGGMHSSEIMGVNGLVAIISSPILKDKSAQQGWSRDLVATKGNNPANLILIEDISASAFKGIVEEKMRKAWMPGTLPILLEDETGKVHASFAVEKDQTKIFVFDKSGKLIYSTAESPGIDAAKTVWSKLAR